MTPEPAVQSVCYRHPDRPTGLACTRCGRPICGACAISGNVGQFCPDCVGGGHRQEVIRAAGRASLRSTAPVTFTIMAVTIAVFALRYVQAPLGNVLLANLAQVNSLVAAGQWWRIFTPVLLHAFPMHILFNMWALYQLGPGVERRAGPPAYLALYFAAAGVGGAFAFHLGSATDALVGASGAIFGLFGLWFHAALRARETAFGRGLLANLGLVLLLNAALPFIYPQISWQGHLGGFVTGLIVGELWARVKDRRSQTLLALAVAAAAALSVIL